MMISLKICKRINITKIFYKARQFDQTKNYINVNNTWDEFTENE